MKECAHCSSLFCMVGRPKSVRFCSNDCYEAHRRAEMVSRTCECCNRTFEARASYVARGQYRFCSRECFMEHEGHRDVPETACETCGTIFKRSSRRRSVRHCSVECRKRQVALTCENCSATFHRSQSGVEGARFCSRRCYLSFGGETSIERIVRHRLLAMALPFRAQVPVGRWNVDFLIADTLVIEADGDYWHSKKGVPARDRRKDRFLRAQGLGVVRLLGSALREDPLIVDRAVSTSGLIPDEVLQRPGQQLLAFAG